MKGDRMEWDKRWKETKDGAAQDMKGDRRWSRTRDGGRVNPREEEEVTGRGEAPGRPFPFP